MASYLTDLGTRPSRRIILAIAALVVPLSAQADTTERFSVSIGAFFTDRDTDTRVDADTTNEGTDIDLENDLGFKKSDTVFRIDAYWRFAGRHRLDVSAFDLSQSATKVIARDITVGDTTYPIDTEVSSTLDLGIYKAAYTWIFLQKERGFLGASLGLYIADIGIGFGGGPGIDRESRDFTAPLPVIGLRGEYALSSRWSIRGSAELFAFEYNAFDGSLYDIFAGIDFAMTDHLSLGLGFDAVQLDVAVRDSDITGDLNWAYSGAMLYLKGDF